VKRVFVCSPFGGSERNLEMAKSYCLAVAKGGNACYAPHLLCPQFLDDNSPSDRDLGISIGLKFLAVCDEMWIFGNEVTSGMIREIKFAREKGIIIKNATIFMDGRIGFTRY